mgnify:CR=1 FL=1
MNADQIRQILEAAPMLRQMIEAVENHNPEVIVIDEIGRELEALARMPESGDRLIVADHLSKAEAVYICDILPAQPTQHHLPNRSRDTAPAEAACQVGASPSVQGDAL